MKQKFSALDIKAATVELQKLVGLRLQNMYDVNSRTFLLKFAKPDVKESVLVESGSRIHLTDFVRDKSTVPSSLCMKLRKHLRTKRLSAVRQLGIDRIVDFEFGFGEATYHLICEFYAAGNVILTDGDYMTLAILRPVTPDNDEGVRYAVGELYDISRVSSMKPLSMDRVVDALLDSSHKDQLKKALGNKLEFSSVVVEHCLVLADIQPNSKVSTVVQSGQVVNKQLLSQIYESLLQAESVFQQVGTQPRGYIMMNRIEIASSQNGSGPQATNLIPDPNDSNYLLAFEEFHPYKFKQFEEKGYFIRELESFNLAADQFFSSIESQKIELKSRAQEDQALKKIASAKQEQLQRIKGLQQAQADSERMAQLIEMNLDDVDRAILVIRSAIASGMDWTSLKDLVKEEQLKQNPVALMIDGLKLEQNQITLLLREPDFDQEYGFEDSDDEEDQEQSDRNKDIVKIDVDISLSAYANARRYFESKKLNAVKEERTVIAAEKVVKLTEKKVQKELQKKVQVAASITRMRKPFWFEKFNWFITTENYLVLGGKDAQQNEMLVKKHFKPGDVYFHADIPGSSSVIVKNSQPDQEIPLATLMQASQMTIVYSKAWDAKVVTSAYWVRHDQVSKTAPSGEYLVTGSFMIRGKKNYMPPNQLVYGLGVLFKVADESIPRHFEERRPYLRGNVEEESAAVGVDAQDDDRNSIVNSVTKDDRSSVAASYMEQQMEKYNLDDVDQQPATLNPFIEDLLKKEQEKSQKQKQQSSKHKIKSKRSGDSQIVESKQAESSSNQQQNQGSQGKNNSAKSSNKLPRGKKSKLKKIKEKYGDQDEDERKEKMKLLASAGTKDSTDSDDQDEQDFRAHSERSENENDQDPEEVDTNNQMPNFQDADDLEEEQKEIERLNAEENIQILESEQMENLSLLDCLTGQPHEDDIILNAIPVCAPYITLQAYKYKVKLLPGNLKKGKAAQSILHQFLNSKAFELTEKEKDAIKAMPDTELTQTVLGKVRIAGVDDEKKGKSRGKRK
ncbi:hypothetical protein MP228_006865 [Amoeboaphelidium protococcarum]|nr:hypothetical protein MP228_006865 [Amoeboaphelidium protococcarum]